MNLHNYQTKKEIGKGVTKLFIKFKKRDLEIYALFSEIYEIIYLLYFDNSIILYIVEIYKFLSIASLVNSKEVSKTFR